MYLVLSNLLYFARGGGGGSSSGGGGGGLIVLVGYVPMHFMGAKLKKITTLLVASFVAWPIALIYAVLLIVVFKGFGFLMGIGSLVGVGAGLYDWFNKIAKLGKRAKKDLAVAVSLDSSWDEASLKKRAQEVFFSYQRDWSNNNMAPASEYMTPWYLYHAKLMVYALALAGRQNYVINPVITDMQIIEVSDSDGRTGDSFVMAFTAKADDQLYDISNKSLLFRDTKSFTEYWRFERRDDQWLLAGIQQSTASLSTKNEGLEQFAAAHQYAFSRDWGWLLLPKRGQLFGKANFGRSDINNHVIGLNNNVLVMLYNYVPVKTAQEGVNNYLIAQVTVPREYGNIVVRKKRILGVFSKPKGLTRINTEWGEFNSKYEVWASDMERVTSLELLHPAFMVKLQELPFEVNIEVVDNIVYLYSRNTKLSAENYATMLSILQEAFKQMRM